MSDLPQIPAEAKEIIKHKRTGKASNLLYGTLIH